MSGFIKETDIWNAPISTLPYNFYYGEAVVLNGEIHILGGYERGTGTNHYKYSNGQWVSVSTLPYDFNNGSAVVLNDEIHILGGYASGTGTYHYKYSNGQWTSVSTLPYNFMFGRAVVLRDRIHILGGAANAYNHYVYDQGSWIQRVDMPYYFISDDGGLAVVLNDEIHILGSGRNQSEYELNHYKYVEGDEAWYMESELPFPVHNGSAVVLSGNIHILGGYVYQDVQIPKRHYKLSNNGSWVSMSTLPYNFYGGAAVVIDSKIYIIGGNGNKSGHYRYYVGDSYWKKVSDLLDPFYGGSAVVFENQVHLLGGYGNNQAEYIYSGGTWVLKASGLPYRFYDGSAVVLDGKIHILGSSDTNCQQLHAYYSDPYWVTTQNNLPYPFYSGSAVVLNGEIHILGSGKSGYKRCHYKRSSNGQWSSVSTLPFDFYAGDAVVLNNEIHILGGGENSQHYKYSNGEWVELTVPQNFYYGRAVVLNNEIYILGGNEDEGHKHYKYIEGSGLWTQVSLPYYFNAGDAVVLNNEIHILGGRERYYDPSDVTPVENYKHYKYVIDSPMKKINRATISVPNGYTTDNGVPIKKYANKNVINAWIGTENGNKLALSSTYSRSSHLNLPGGFLLAPFFVAEYKGKIYMLVDEKFNDNPITLPAFLVYNDDTQNWTQLTAPPIEHGHIGAASPNTAFMVVYNDKLHFIMPWWSKHYCWDGTSWQEITMPVTYYQYGRAYEGWSRCVVFKPEGENEEKIYLLNVADMSSGGSISEAPCGYVYYTDTDGWSSNVYTYPYEDVDLHFITATRENYPVITTYKGEIHVLGCGEDGKYHYSWNGTNQGKWHNWSDDPLWPLADSMPYDSRGLMAAISINDCIYCIGGDYTVASAISEEHMKLVYSWNPDREISINGMKGWHREEDLPYIARGGYYIYGGAVIHKNRIYILSIDGEVDTGLSVNPTMMILNPLCYFD